MLWQVINIGSMDASISILSEKNSGDKKLRYFHV